MEWGAITRESLEEMMAAGLTEMDDSVQAAWHAMRIEPEKWQCSPWGDAGGGFWAVAVKDHQVVWYNDIEDGFNVSPFTRWGTIDEYWCNDTSFAEFLLGLPEAQAAESWSDSMSATTVPSDLEQGGTITRRQTTYWELLSGAGHHWRLHFKSKAELRFDKPVFSHVELVDEHPVLKQYVEPWDQLYYTGQITNPEQLKQLLAERIQTASSGWRSLDDYLWPRADLSKTYGLLLHAPRGIVAIASKLLSELGVRPSVLAFMTPKERLCAVILDTNYVVARAFWFESGE